MIKVLSLKIKKMGSGVGALWALCFLINIFSFFILYYQIHPGPKTMALHYNVLVGVEWYGKGTNLYLIPAAAFFISLTNFIIFIALKKTSEFFAPLTVFVSFCVQIILFFSIIFLAKVN